MEEQTVTDQIVDRTQELDSGHHGPHLDRKSSDSTSPSIKTNPSPYILLRRQTSSPPQSSPTQLKPSESTPKINGTLLIGSSPDHPNPQTPSPNSTLTFGSVTPNLPQDQPSSQQKALGDTLASTEEVREGSSPSSVGSGKRTDQLDTTVVEAMMTGTVRDKQILLQAEAEMARFVSSNQLRHPLGSALSISLNSYQRMLVHRLGDSFGIKRTMDMGHMVMERTPQSACPSIRLESFIIRQDASPSNVPSSTSQAESPSLKVAQVENATSQNNEDVGAAAANPSPTLPLSTVPLKTFKIMSRTPSQRSTSRQTNNKAITPSAGSSVSSGDANNSEAKRNELSYEARQAAYQQARNRIFASEATEGAEGTSGQAGIDGLSSGSSELDVTTNSKSNGGSADGDANSSSITRAESSNDDPSLNGGSVRVSNVPCKGKEKMAPNARSAKLAAKLRPGATTFDPNAKAHGYEEVTIIDFDQPDPSIPWPAHDPYAYPSDPVNRQFHTSRQSRPGHMYGNGFSPTHQVQHQTSYSIPNNGQIHYNVPYGPPPSSNGFQPMYMEPHSIPHSGMAPYQPPPPSFATVVGVNQLDYTRPSHSQNTAPSGSFASNHNGRSFNAHAPNPPPDQRALAPQARFHDPPFQNQYAAHSEMDLGGISQPDAKIENGGQPNVDQPSVARPSTNPQTYNPQTVGPLVQPSSEVPRSGDFSQSMSYPSHPHISAGMNSPQHHMDQYHRLPQPIQAGTLDTNISPHTFSGPWPQPSAAPQRFQPVPPTYMATSNPSTIKDVARANAPSTPNPQSHTAVNPQPSKHYSHADLRIHSSNPTGHTSSQPSPNLYPPSSSFQGGYQSNLAPQSSSVSSSSEDSSHRPASSSLSRNMSTMKLSDSNDPKSTPQISRSSNTHQSRAPPATDNMGRYPRPPPSLGNVSVTSGGSGRLTRPKKHDASSDSTGQDEAGSMKSFHSDSDHKLLQRNGSTASSLLQAPHSLSSQSLTDTQSKELMTGESRRTAKHSGSANSTTSSDAVSTNSSETHALQHPLPPKPLWVGNTKISTKPLTKSVSSTTWSLNPSLHYPHHPQDGHPFRDPGHLPTGVSPTGTGTHQSSRTTMGSYNGDQNRGFAHDESRTGFNQLNYPAFPDTSGSQPSASQMAWHPPSHINVHTLPPAGYAYNNTMSPDHRLRTTCPPQINTMYNQQVQGGTIQPPPTLSNSGSLPLG